MKSTKTAALFAAILMNFFVIACGQVPAFKQVNPQSTTTADNAKNQDTQNTEDQGKPSEEKTDKRPQGAKPEPIQSTKPTTSAPAPAAPAAQAPAAATKAPPTLGESQPPPGTTAPTAKADGDDKKEDAAKKIDPRKSDPKGEASNKPKEVPKSIAAKNTENLKSMGGAVGIQLSQDEIQRAEENEHIRNLFLTGSTVKDIISALDSAKPDKNHDIAKEMTEKLNLMNKIDFSNLKEVDTKASKKFESIGTSGNLRSYIGISVKPIIPSQAYEANVLFDTGKTKFSLPGIITVQNVKPKFTDKSNQAKDIVNFKSQLLSKPKIIVLKIKGVPDQILLASAKYNLVYGEASQLKPNDSLLDKVMIGNLGITSVTTKQDILKSFVDKKPITLSVFTQNIESTSSQVKDVEVASIELLPIDGTATRK